jgi:hypothetical protein
MLPARVRHIAGIKVVLLFNDLPRRIHRKTIGERLRSAARTAIPPQRR